MKYARNRDESGETLRLVIKNMATHPAAFTPYNYAVWYEHVSGINPALSAAINKALGDGSKLDDDRIENFYKSFVADTNTDRQLKLQHDLGLLLGKITGFTEETDKQAVNFGNSLQSYVESMKPDIDPEQLGTLLDNMTGDTNTMRGSIMNLQNELANSKNEVQKLHEELESVRTEAHNDPLTGILNRRGFKILAQKNMSDKMKLDKGLCMLMLDIDHFKKVNDTYGHLFGDKVLTMIASTLKSKIKGQDVLARLGGEEFAVLLPETQLIGAQAVAESIRRSIEKTRIRRMDSDESIGVTISIGITAYGSGDTLVGMLDQADKALYVSKNSGRNKTSVHLKENQH